MIRSWLIFVFIIQGWIPIAFAQNVLESTLLAYQKFGYVTSTVPNFPTRLSNNWTDKQKASLQKWSTAYLPSLYKSLYMDKSPDQKWLTVYFELKFEINSPKLEEDTTISDSLDQIWTNIGNFKNRYTKATNLIEVSLSPLISIYFNGELVDTQGEKKDLKIPVRPITVFVISEDSKHWKKRGKVDNKGKARAYTDEINGNIIISSNNWSTLVHEMGHALFRHVDAYYEPGRHNVLTYEEGKILIDKINMRTFTTDPDPIEIYVGIKRAGYEVPGWDDYVSIQNEKLDVAFSSIFR